MRNKESASIVKNCLVMSLINLSEVQNEINKQIEERKASMAKEYAKIVVVELDGATSKVSRYKNQLEEFLCDNKEFINTKGTCGTWVAINEVSYRTVQDLRELPKGYHGIWVAIEEPDEMRKDLVAQVLEREIEFTAEQIIAETEKR